MPKTTPPAILVLLIVQAFGTSDASRAGDEPLD
jgi:hypothetical protein